MRRRLLVVFVIGLTGGLALPAGGAPPLTETITEHQVTETFVDFFTCDPADLYEITVTFNFIEHSTVFPDGRLHVTFTQTGTFEATALDPADLDASGHFAVWGGFNNNGKSLNGTFTFNVTGLFEDGSRVSTHAVDHFNVTPTDAAFFWGRCRD